MAKLKIYTFPDDVLSKKAQKIEKITDKHRKLAEDMLDTMYDAPGIGLAANQVGVLERIIVIDVSYEIETLEDGDSLDIKEAEISSGAITNKDPLVLINPEIVHREGELAISEGCLSVPDYTAEVDRSRKVTVEYQDLDGNPQTLEAEELLAVCVQHEIDHLNGKLFIDRLSPVKQEMVKKKLRAGKKLNNKKINRECFNVESRFHGHSGVCGSIFGESQSKL